MKKIEKFKMVLMNYKSIKMIIGFYFNGYLKEIGWINSFEKKMPFGVNGEEIPWITYSAIEFLKEKLNSTMELFEYGSGNSTKYYSTKVKKIIAIEHDEEWYNKIKSGLKENAEIVYKKLEYNGEYCRMIKEFENKFDVVIIDGRDRVNCVKNSIERLKENGVIILDDSERKEYDEAKEFLFNKGYKKIEFWGIAPGVFYNKCTTVFYKDDNCFEI